MCGELSVSESKLFPASQFGEEQEEHQVFGDMSFLRNVHDPGLLLAGVG